MVLLVFLLNLCLAGEPEDKAIEAAYIQSGLKYYSDGTLNYLNNNYINKSSILRNGSMLYMVYRNRCTKFEYKWARAEVGLGMAKIEWVFRL